MSQRPALWGASVPEASSAIPVYRRGHKYRSYSSRVDLEMQADSDETYPLTAYPSQPETQPRADFESETGASGYDYQSEYDPQDNFPSNNDQNEQQSFTESAPPEQIPLYNGHVVLEYPLPSRLLNLLPNKRSHEFTHTRYTAVTCDPADFPREKFDLRQVLYTPRRSIKLFVVITLYNEKEELLLQTMRGVLENIAHLCSLNVWGKDGWREIVVCIVADGREKINIRTLYSLGLMGVYWKGIIKETVEGKSVKAHLFENTAQLSIDKKMKIRVAAPNAPPCQIIFCLKEQNQKKLNSHRWFFQAFCPVLQPTVCILLDAGTKPDEMSFYFLWKAFKRDEDVAGACGEIIGKKGQSGKSLLNPIVSAQYFEYKMSNILDKPLESVFGFISVLPGAFSAYRYTALLNDHLGQGPLASYFKGEILEDSNAGIFERNMYLAEDRILCFELVAKRGAAWKLRYVRDAHAETDVPDELSEWIPQRRRWLNGSFFAAIYAITHAFMVFRTEHSTVRKIMFQVEFLYQTISLLFSWFALANFYLIFVILAGSMDEPAVGFSPGYTFFTIFNYCYISLVIMCFVLSMGNRPQGSKIAYLATTIFFAILMLYILFCSIWLTVKGVQQTLATLHSEDAHFGKDFGKTIGAIFGNKIFRDLIVSTLSTYALYMISSILFADVLHMFTSFFQYLLLSPSYVNVLNVFAFCNIHDLSWGTKSDTTSDPKKKDPGSVDRANVDTPNMKMVGNLDDEYDLMTEVLEKSAPSEPRDKREVDDKHKDYTKSLRTRVLMAWIMSNLLLIVIVLRLGHGVVGINVGESRSNTGVYLTIVLWSVAVLAAFRLIGSITYLILSKVQK